MNRKLVSALSTLAFLLAAGWAQAQGWTLKDAGVGLVIQDAEYASALKIAARGDKWDLKELYENGALAGRYRGNQAFAAWLAGPPTESYLNKNGVPVWMYKYKITYPSGKSHESGASGFYAPGFAVVSLNPGGETTGQWKIEWFIVNRDTNEVRPAATVTFTSTW